MEFLELKTQQKRIRKPLEKRINKILDHGAYIMGPEVFELENKLADYCGVKHAISCSSGTDALLIPLMAWGIGPGDAIFTTPFTYVATAEVIAILGATPIFVDVYESTYNIDCEKLEIEINKVIKEGKLTPKAIIPVDLFGLPARYRLIDKIAKKYNLKIIEDAAQSFGGSIRDKRVGTFGDIAATSFYPAKPLGCYGDGGAIFTNDDSLAEECKAIRIHGTKADRYNSESIGLNGRFDSIQAAVVLEKLTIFDDELEKRNIINANYRKYLNNAQYHPQGYQSAHALFSITMGSKNKRDELIKKLTLKNIPTVIYYKLPIHMMKAFDYLGYKDNDLPISKKLSQTIVSLPMHPYLASEDINKIIETIKR
ncbi:MAG: DegT/DnrJ/EryC1/StrS family aminotransferase [Candidatus Neomarinimicrobiota bacterium]|nr:DegT/DnrJ/EryC1/StrS family aminotransferase [Candidatus Neomarinimicrobiota bacterium]